MGDLSPPLSAGEPGGLSERQFRTRISLALAAGLAALVVMAATAWGVGDRLQAHAAWVAHTYAAEAKIYRLQSLVEKIETARRGYLIEQRDSYWITYEGAARAIPDALSDLADFTADNPAQVATIKRLRPVISDKLNTVATTMTLAHIGDPELATKTFRADANRQLTVQTRDLTDALLKEEARLLGVRLADQRRATGLLLVIVLSGAVLVAVLAAGSVWIIRRYEAGLISAQDALRKLNLGLEAKVEARTFDLVRANEEIQRFAYIVSHDLRAPLVNVMGFTSELEVSFQALKRLAETAEARAPDLVGRDARLAIEQDLPEAIRFIRASTQKMDRLINAILKLSREGRRNLTPEPVDMTALARNAAASLKSQADGRGAEIVVESDLPAIVTDRLAMEQVLGNLLENGIKYLSPARAGRVVVRGRSEGRALIYDIEDNGRGIDPKDHERVFDLFRRSGAQDQPGEGIGLAAVKTLVQRLGGRITLTSALDQGATFRLSLPPVLSPAKEAAA